MFCRLVTGDCAQGFSDSILLMDEHLTKDSPQQTLLQSNDPWVTTESDVKPYILELLDNIKLSRSQYIATSIINYGSYIDNMFALEKLCICTLQTTFDNHKLKPPIPCP